MKIKLQLLILIAFVVTLCGCSVLKSAWAKIDSTVNSAINTTTTAATNVTATAAEVVK